MKDLIAGISMLALIVVAFIGYVKNIIVLFAMQFPDAPIGELVLRIVGIFVPFIGAIVGYF